MRIDGVALAGGLLLALIPLACGQPSPGTMEIDLVVRDLLADPPEWEVEEEHQRKGPHVDIICPSLQHGRDGADMVSLVLSPPSQVSFTIEPGDGPAYLRLRAGVDITATKHFTEDVPEGIFAFEVLVNGRPVESSEVVVRDDEARPGSEWADLGDGRGILVKVGDRVTLRMAARAPDGTDIRPPAAVVVGFGGLRLERTVRRERSRSAPERPNVVLVLMDTLRADRLSTYGYERPTSPHLDRLAERGTLFESAYAASSWTWPSTASLFTGLLPEEHGVFDSASSFLSSSVDTLAEELQEQGFTTAAWTANPLISKSRNFDQGFEHFADDIGNFRWAGEYFHEVEAWIHAQAGTRFFLYLHLIEPHRPYRPLAEGWELLAPDVPDTVEALGQSVAERLTRGRAIDDQGHSILDRLTTAEEREQIERIYDACVWSGDHWLGRLVQTLEAAELDDETLILFTSDHGEEIFERSFLGHSMSVYAELVRVPFVLAGPGIPAGRRIEAPISNRDAFSFLASLGSTGDDVRDAVESLLREHAAPVFYSTEKGYWRGDHNVTIRGMRHGSIALQVSEATGTWPEPDSDVHARMFDLAQDPGENRDLSGARAEEAQRHKELLERFFDGLVPQHEESAYRTGPGTTLLLERIGYAGR